MRIVIHTGMHKTGTTSVQKTLLESSEILSRIGWRVFVNAPQINVRNNNTFDEHWLLDKIRIAENDGMRTVIISMEAISTFSAQQLSKLVGALSLHEVILVVCFSSLW